MKNCECCMGSYKTGKNYSDEWCELPVYDRDGIIPPKGLCEFCNPNCEKWYVPEKKCHALEKVVDISNPQVDFIN